MNLHDLLFKPAQLKAGETKISNGAITLCINPDADRGPLWAIQGRCARFSTHEHSGGYVKGLCRQVSPGKGFVTMEIIKGPYPAGTVLDIALDEFRRYVNSDDEEDTHLKSLLPDATGSGHGAHELPPSRRLRWDRSTKLNQTMNNLDDTGLDARQLRALGAVMGALVGDAAGGVLEFMGRAPTRQEVDEAMQMPGGGVFELAPGQFTDDGEMTVSLVRALLAAKGAYRPELAAQHYSEWEKSRPFDIGMATRAALGMPSAGSQTPTQVLKRVRSQALEHNAESKANGSLMRASPLGIAACGCSEDEAIDLALADAQLTHPNPSCQHATAAYVLALRHLMLSPGDSAGAILAAQAYVQVQSKEVSAWLADAVSGHLPDAQPKAGFVRYGFTYAFHYLHSGASFERAITETLLRGGDTDTNACIVGGLVGAHHGLNGLPQLALKGVLNCNTQFGRRRPDNFTVVPVMNNLTLLSQYCLPAGSAS